MSSTNDMLYWNNKFYWNKVLTTSLCSGKNIINEVNGLHFFNKGCSVFLISNYDKVFGLGKKHVCFDVDYKEEAFLPVEIKGINNCGIDSLFTGKLHAALLDKNGDVFCWGRNDGGQIGCGKGVYLKKPYKLSLPKIRQISCGANITLALSCENEIWFWGYKLKLDIEKWKKLPSSCNDIVWKPKKITLQDNIKSISVGHSHATILNDEGKVYIWGSDEIDAELDVLSEINVPRKVKHAVSFKDFNFFVTDNDSFYCSHGRNEINKIDLSPIHFPVLTKEITAIASTYDDCKITIANSSGEVYDILLNQQYLSKPIVSIWSHKPDIYKLFIITPIVQYYQPSHYCKGTGIMPYIRDNTIINVSHLFNVNNFSDLIIKLRNDQIFAHKLVLVNQSKHFKKLLEADCNQRQLDVSNLNPESYKGYIKYLYTGDLDVQLDCLPEVYSLADQDDNCHLKTLCMANWLKGMTKDNILQLYHAAYIEHVEIMMKSCGPILHEHLPDLLSSAQINKISAEEKFSLTATALTALHNKKYCFY